MSLMSINNLKQIHYFAFVVPDSTKCESIRNLPILCGKQKFRSDVLTVN
jgi:hypothetical protein